MGWIIHQHLFYVCNFLDINLLVILIFRPFNWLIKLTKLKKSDNVLNLFGLLENTLSNTEKKGSNFLVLIAVIAIIFAVVFPNFLDKKSSINSIDDQLIVQPNENATSSQPSNTTALPPAEIAIAIVYDTSGSMNEKVASKNGTLEPKYVIANRAFDQVVDSIDKYVNAKEPIRTVYTGLFTFKGVPCPLGVFNSKYLKFWLSRFNHPNGGTPLGDTIESAGRGLLEMNAFHKHILVLTDGKNTDGKDPEVVIRNLKKDAYNKGSLLYFHVIGFNVEDKVFAPLKKEDVNVFSAINESELILQLDTLFKEKILLEAEDK